ncbi:DUF3549 family protein [Thalassotalea agarivorans]|uniref:DUF3549 domain-containing protein n=1 Tax=Thalassotalea agarivorans TaxID=349064 RepID=A0A1I0DN37_THASX|nr:DUF3549 family protein [Thalassotalea agarivorans]SET33617.1 Protein of unknown function [Thalassotalea agarivorans]
MNSIETITELLQLSNCQYRVYDIGRNINKITKEQFEKLEHNQVPYPYPMQGHAHLAIAFWQKQSVQLYIWFVKLPLDERSLLVQASRNHFLAIILEALGSDLTKDPTEHQQELLNANPYHFTPAQYKLASLNSLISIALKKNASVYFEHCQEYLQNKDWPNWHNIGVQGIADYVARIDDENLASTLEVSLPHLPKQVLYPLCSAMENQTLPLTLIQAIALQIEQCDLTEEQEKAIHLLRALSASATHMHVTSLVDNLLNLPSLNEEIIITLSSRLWLSLDSGEKIAKLFQHVLLGKAADLFPAIYKDLVAIPATRAHVFSCMRSENRSQELSKAIGQLFNQGT